MEQYTMEQWQKDGSLKPAIGQAISEEVYWELLGAMPPACNERGIFQCGEPYSHDWNTGRALYMTFENLVYVGLKTCQAL